MFSNKPPKSTKEGKVSVVLGVTDVPSIIAADMKIKGNLSSSGAIEIEGEIEGNVNCAQVTVRRNGRVKGDVVAEHVSIDGEVNGLVKGKFIVVSEAGRVSGVLMYESLSIKDGAQIDGQCKSVARLHRGDVQALDLEDIPEDNAKNSAPSLTAVKDDPSEKISVLRSDRKKTLQPA